VPAARDVNLIDLYGQRDRRYRRRNTMAMLREIRGVRSKGAYIQAMLLPSADYVEGRGGYAGRLRRAVTHLSGR
jgi:hypothetical protein